MQRLHRQFILKADISEVVYNDYIANLNLKYLSKFNNLSSRTIQRAFTRLKAKSPQKLNLNNKEIIILADTTYYGKGLDSYNLHRI
ncbi:hypothetical protein [Campylobacter sp. JMF_08 NE1]|uniref:hypothetical protein n=1 Tax=Campylobacter sp. JMF_08 NE1 TaxID=2983821 RepID=UPI0022E9C818|nr:hypothetical protein [Campylobacter sp. JMF_08 NE1]MDA3047615.1 hypothetical protein [Campylobacter sp. JMF_08 NE1]